MAEVLWIAKAGVERHPLEEVGSLSGRNNGLLWVDFAEPNADAVRTLSDVFGFHPLAVQDCIEPARIPKIHAYRDHVFLRLHVPEPGTGGKVHLLELSLFVGARYLVTVHQPSDAVPRETILRETLMVSARLTAGRFQPTTTSELSYAIVSAVARRMEAFVWTLAGKIAALEQDVMRAHGGSQQEVLDELFRLRHELLALRTAAAQSRELYARMASLASRAASPDARPYIDDLLDQFDRVRGMCDGEREFLQGVLDFYQTQTAHKMNLAMERLALLTAIVMPITAVASIYGMNIIAPAETSWLHLGVVLAIMGLMALGIIVWSKRRGWW